MARPLRIEYEGAFYHIIQRGNERKDIFLSDQNRARFYEYLSILHTRYKVNIHTYCLMKNHYHLIVETECSNLTRAMHYLNTSYAAYFNAKTKRVGHLFQGRYKSILVEADEYLHHLSRYIHLNPVRARIIKSPGDYPHASLRYFITDIGRPDWLCTDFILSMFDKNIIRARSLYRQFVLNGAGGQDDIIKNNTNFGFLLGSQDFINNIKARFIEGKKDSEIPVLRAARSRLIPDNIKNTVIKVLGDNKLSHKVCMYLIRKHAYLSLKEIAALFKGISDAGVSVLCRRMEDRRKRDTNLSKKIIELEKLLIVET